MGKFNDEQHNDEQPPQAQRFCAANGCPLPGTTQGETTQGQWCCRFHSKLPMAYWDQVTLNIRQNIEIVAYAQALAMCRVALHEGRLLATAAIGTDGEAQEYPMHYGIEGYPDTVLLDDENHTTHRLRIDRLVRKAVFDGVENIERSGPRRQSPTVIAELTRGVVQGIRHD